MIYFRMYAEPCPEGPQHAPSTQKTPPLGRSRFDRDKYVSADARPSADIPNRLRYPPVPVWRLACFCTMRQSSSRVHSTHHALAGGASASNLALSHGRFL
jgi:hypothetical protein